MKKSLPVLSSFLLVALASFFYFNSRDKVPAPQADIADPAPAKSSDPIAPQQVPEAVGKVEEVSPVNLTAPVKTPDVLTAEFKKRHAETVASQLGTDLNSLLANTGFAQAEIDLASKNIGDAFLHPVDGVVKLSQAIDETASSLRLNADRKKDLEKAVFTAIGNSTSRYSFTEYQACVRLRTTRASTCVKEIADDLTRKVSASAEGDNVDAKTILALEPEAAMAVKRAVDECKEKPEVAEAYLTVNLAGCL